MDISRVSPSKTKDEKSKRGMVLKHELNEFIVLPTRVAFNLSRVSRNFAEEANQITPSRGRKGEREEKLDKSNYEVNHAIIATEEAANFVVI